MNKLGFFSATLIGIGAIVGGGIFVLGGVAITAAGPAAIVAFLLNGLLALLTARSFASIVKIFPETGGAYLYAKRILSVRAGFVIGWMLWLAHIVAALLYALGFSAYCISIFSQIAPRFIQLAPERVLSIGLSAAACAFYSWQGMRRLQSDGKFSNITKLALFAGLILFGGAIFLIHGESTAEEQLTPFFSDGFHGLIAAMGYTFIALQGFELIAASAGDIATPRTAVPKAMYLSLGIALVIYVPLLFLTIVSGVPAGESPAVWCSTRSGTCVAEAFKNFLGLPGYWVVAISAIAATLTALQANLVASAKIARVMAEDRTMPTVLSHLHEKFQTPDTALIVNLVIVLILLIALPDVEAAGSAASLTFLLCFSFTNFLAALIARRKAVEQNVFAQLLPFAVGVICLLLAIFQLSVEQSSGVLLLGWILLGSLFYYIFLSQRAEVLDAYVAAYTPSLFSYRGRATSVLVPMKNPEHVPGLLSIAFTLTPVEASKILLLSMVDRAEGEEAQRQNLHEATEVVAKALSLSAKKDQRKIEGIIAINDDPWSGILETANTHQSETLLLGFQGENSKLPLTRISSLLNNLRMNVVVLNAPQGWTIDNVTNVLVPIGGKGIFDKLRARILGRIISKGKKDITFLRVLPQNVSASSSGRIERSLQQRVADETSGFGKALVLQKGNIEEAILEHADKETLIVLGFTPGGISNTAEDSFIVRVAKHHNGPTLLIGHA